MERLASYLRSVLLHARFDTVCLYLLNGCGVLPWLLDGRVLRQESLESNSIGFQLKLFDRYFAPVTRRVEAHGRPLLGTR